MIGYEATTTLSLQRLQVASNSSRYMPDRGQHNYLKNLYEHFSVFILVSCGLTARRIARADSLCEDVPHKFSGFVVLVEFVFYDNFVLKLVV